MWRRGALDSLVRGNRLFLYRRLVDGLVTASVAAAFWAWGDWRALARVVVPAGAVDPLDLSLAVAQTVGAVVLVLYVVSEARLRYREPSDAPLAVPDVAGERLAAPDAADARLAAPDAAGERFARALDDLGANDPTARRDAITTLDLLIGASAVGRSVVAQAVAPLLRRRLAIPLDARERWAHEAARRALPGDGADGPCPPRDDATPPPDAGPDAETRALLAVLVQRGAAEAQGRDALDLAFTDLRGADLRDGCLSRAVLQGADLAGALLVRAQLHRACLIGANGRAAVFRGADLRQGNLAEGFFEAADFGDADLTEAQCPGARFHGARFERATLRQANFAGADLAGAALRDAVLRDAVLRNAVLTQADLSGADLVAADLRGADLARAVGLTRAQIAVALTNQATILPDTLGDGVGVTGESGVRDGV